MARRADQRKFHYIYKITRFDGAYYIGLHSTDDLEDGYFGSGQRLWRSINYHGKDKHSMEILEFLPSRKDLILREEELVDPERLKDPLCMNLRLGGSYLYKKPDSEEARKNKSMAHKAHYASESGALTKQKLSEAHTGRKHTEEAKQNMGMAAKERMTRMKADGSWEEVKKKNAEAHRGKKQSEETIAKRNASISAFKEANGGKRTFSDQARLNISASLKGSARNVKTWELISVQGERIQVTNLAKWLKDHDLKAGAKVVVRDKDGNITHRFVR
jgi:hypothetical protein